MRRTHNEKLVDKLSRATASQDGARGSDILGNTTMITYSGNVQRTFDWDCLNRLLDKKASGVVQASYNYRADGMRVGKYVASGNKTTVYRYDGQMGMEDVETSPGTSTVTDYAIGARGVDGISTSVNGAASTVAYPIYDAHGNMVATLAKGGSNTYSVGSQRSYDAWGGIRIGNLTGDPKQQYCASFGHRADDETGFIYMRSRYYEPSTGRFLSEDPSMYGSNWFAYACNAPTIFADYSGKEPGLIGAVLELIKGVLQVVGKYAYGQKVDWGRDLFKVAFKTAYGVQEGYVTAFCIKTMTAIIDMTADGLKAATLSGGGLASETILDACAEAIMLCLFIDAIDIGSGDALCDMLTTQVFGEEKK